MSISERLNERNQKKDELKTVQEKTENEMRQALKQAGFTSVGDITIGGLKTITVEFTRGILDRDQLDQLDDLSDDCSVSSIQGTDGSDDGLIVSFEADLGSASNDSTAGQSSMDTNQGKSDLSMTTKNDSGNQVTVKPDDLCFGFHQPEGEARYMIGFQAPVMRIGVVGWILPEPMLDEMGLMDAMSPIEDNHGLAVIHEEELRMKKCREALEQAGFDFFPDTLDDEDHRPDSIPDKTG